jgi:flavin reductase (DIM6/NTAB) family NADH-FMN oxidoreductase RutF
MKHLSKEEFDDLQKFYRINLINSCTGYKSANLLGSISKEGIENVSVFSSITHLGSNPAMLGYILRPTTVPRDTFKNIKETGFFTVNHIFKDIISEAHHTSAKYPEEISEFDKTNLEKEYKDGCKAPFVKGSPVQLICKYQNEYNIKENGTILVVASIEDIYFNEELVSDSGFLQLDKGGVVTVNGCDGYALPSLLDRFEYQRPKK